MLIRKNQKDNIRITLQDVDNYFSVESKKIWNQDYLDKIKNLQLSIESNLRLYNISCPLPRNSEPLHSLIFLSEAFDEKSNKINFIHSDFAHTYQRLQFNSCLFNSLIDKDDQLLSTNGKIQEYLKNFKLLKYAKSNPSSKNFSESQYTRKFVFTADLGNLKDLVVVKSGFVTDNHTLVHEAIVGIYGTNLLRRKIPNYAFVYGAFSCLPPVVDINSKNKEYSKVINFCQKNIKAQSGDDNNVNYILYENVKGISMNKYVKTCSGVQFVKVILQIIFALYYGEKTIKFTHYDLHAENVIIRSLPKLFYKGEFQIAYESVNNIIYLNCENVATMIDYEFSHISVRIGNQDQNLGTNDYIDYSILPDRPWIFHDIYKILMSSYYFARKNKIPNTEVMNECFRILSLLSDDNIQEIDDKLSGDGSKISMLFFPYNLKTKNKKSDDFIEEIINLYPQYINVRDQSLPLLNAYNEDFQITDLKNLTNQSVYNIIPFYQMLNFYEKHNEKIQVMQRYFNKNFIEYNINVLYYYNDFLRNLSQTLITNPLLQMDKQSINDSILTTIFLENFKQINYQLVSFYKNHERYISLINIFNAILKLFIDNSYNLKIDNKSEFINFIKNKQKLFQEQLTLLKQYVIPVNKLLQRMKEIYFIIDNFFTFSLKSEYSNTPAAWYWIESKVIREYLFV
jgi:hypothetical protein